MNIDDMLLSVMVDPGTDRIVFLNTLPRLNRIGQSRPDTDLPTNWIHIESGTGFLG